MNLAETAGGSSCKGQENGDASNESERPLKKARFAWQVKGKYHLKNDANDPIKATSTTSPDLNVAESSGSGSSCNNSGTEQNLEILGDYLLKQDLKSLDCVISAPESSLSPSPSISNEKLPYPRYVSSYEQSNMSNNGLKRTSESCPTMKTLPPSLMMTQRFVEDQCIARWQTKQIVKGLVDNTINRVLDLWIQVPLPPEDTHPTRSVALDVAEFINNLPGDNSVENEGILMAISAHGLQQPGSSNSSNEIDNRNLNNLSLLPNDTDSFCPLTVPSDDDSFCPLTLPSDDESHEPVNNSNPCDTDTSNDLDMTWSYPDEHNKENSQMTMFPLFPDANSMSYEGVDETRQNSSAECDVTDNSVDNHCDFLDEAILFAIQSKGLTTFGSDYG